MIEFLGTIFFVLLPPVLFVGLIVRLVQAAPYLCDECHGSPWNMYTSRTCGCGNGINPHRNGCGRTGRRPNACGSRGPRFKRTSLALTDVWYRSDRVRDCSWRFP
jgi:hypothetical protein